MKPYQRVAIAECGDPLVPLADEFLCLVPHPYASLGAPYADKSPFFVRQGVRDRLLIAQATLQQTHPGWRLLVFDAYRPIAVQQFMVNYTFRALVQAAGLQPECLSAEQQQDFLAQVYEFWAVPNLNPATPPPHSTGAAIDLTLVDHQNQTVDMGSPIDELSPRSYPDHFSASADVRSQQHHADRQLLNQCLTTAGFRRHPHEWWHFSYGDQMWVWLTGNAESARYGGIRESLGFDYPGF